MTIPAYITYLRYPWLQPDTDGTRPGWGETPWSSEAASVYLPIHDADVITCRFRSAPKWAQEEVKYLMIHQHEEEHAN